MICRHLREVLPSLRRLRGALPSLRRLRGALLVAVSAVGFGLTPLFARYAYAGGSNLVTLLLIRFLVAAAVLWLYLLARRVPVRVGRGDLLRLLAMGLFGYAVMSSLYYSAVRYVPVALAALLLNVFPVPVTLLAWWLYRERPTWRIAMALVGALAGVVLVLGAATAGYNPLGAGLALGSAAAYSLYVIAGVPVTGRVNALVMAAYVMTAAACGFAGAALAGAGLTLRLTPAAWGGVLGNAFIGAVVSIPAFFAGLALVGSAATSVISTIDPLVAIFASALLLGERLSLLQGFGAALVMGSSLLIAGGQR